LPGVHVRLAGQATACTTLLAYAGGYQLTLSSVLVDAGVELHSSYLGHPAAARAAVGHLLLTTSGVTRAWTREPPGAELPVFVGRRRCLLDHLAQLQTALAEHAGPCHIELDDTALDHVDLA
jgi:hypothetical protein